MTWEPEDAAIVRYGCIPQAGARSKVLRTMYKRLRRDGHPKGRPHISHFKDKRVEEKM